MNLTQGLLPAPLYWIALFACALLLLWATCRAPWQRLRTSENLHVFLGSCVILLLLWQMKAGLIPGLYYHVLGGTLFTLMFGWPLAFIGMALVVAGATANGTGDWTSFALNLLVMGGVPIVLTQVLYRLAIRHLPHHFFVYVMFNAYLGGAVAMASAILISLSLLACCGPYPFSRLTQDYLPFAPLMIFAEAFFSGMLAASIALMRPQWIATFDDRRYLVGK